MKYSLLLKSTGEVIDTLDAVDHEEAKWLFMQRKALKEVTFDQLFEVKPYVKPIK